MVLPQGVSPPVFRQTPIVSKAKYLGSCCFRRCHLIMSLPLKLPRSLRCFRDCLLPSPQLLIKCVRYLNINAIIVTVLLLSNPTPCTGVLLYAFVLSTKIVERMNLSLGFSLGSNYTKEQKNWHEIGLRQCFFYISIKISLALTFHHHLSSTFKVDYCLGKYLHFPNCCE